jgi:hypothetical protein
MELLLLLPFANNIVMSGIKWLFSDQLKSSASRNWKLRLILSGLSLVGVVSMSLLNGSPVDPNMVTDLLSTAILTIGVAVASHFSYKVIAT